MMTSLALVASLASCNAVAPSCPVPVVLCNPARYEVGTVLHTFGKINTIGAEGGAKLWAFALWQRNREECEALLSLPYPGESHLSEMSHRELKIAEETEHGTVLSTADWSSDDEAVDGEFSAVLLGLDRNGKVNCRSHSECDTIPYSEETIDGELAGLDPEDAALIGMAKGLTLASNIGL